ncbi:MAG: class I SAM-dependent methyltransferase [Candidatus Berkiella sp.]
MLSSPKRLNSSAQIAIAITGVPKGTGYLAFRDLPKILEDHVKGTEALDVGCGSGRSTKFLKALGYNVIGIDNSNKMISKAKEEDPTGDYRLITDEEIEWPVEGQQFDLIMFSFVLLECRSKEKIIELLKKAKNHLNESGVIVISSTTEEAYKHDWLSMGTDFPENASPQSGDIVKIFLKDYNFEIKDFFWTDNDYRNCFENSGLNLLWTYNPLGNQADGKPWINEKSIAPFTIYVTKNKPG